MHAANDADLIDDRELEVPRELVFEAWTVPEHFARWFAPHGVEVPVCEMDPRPGGAIRFQHLFPSGELVSIKGVFDEVVAPARLRFTFTFVDAADRPTAPPVFPEWPIGAHIVMTVELHATRRGTRMTVHQRVAEAEHAGTPPVVRHRELAGEGWRQTAERLVEYLERRSSRSWPRPKLSHASAARKKVGAERPPPQLVRVSPIAVNLAQAITLYAEVPASANLGLYLHGDLLVSLVIRIARGCALLFASRMLAQHVW